MVDFFQTTLSDDFSDLIFALTYLDADLADFAPNTIDETEIIKRKSMCKHNVSVCCA